MKEIKVRIKLPSKQELNKQLDDLTKNGVDLNFNEGNLKKSINNANAQLNKLKETISNISKTGQEAQIRLKFDGVETSAIKSFAKKMGLKFTEELSNEVMTTFKNGNINDSINKVFQEVLANTNTQMSKTATKTAMTQYQGFIDEIKGKSFSINNIQFDKSELSKLKEDIRGTLKIDSKAVGIDTLMGDIEKIGEKWGFAFNSNVIQDNVIKLGQVISEYKNLKKNGVSDGLSSQDEQHLLASTYEAYIDMISVLENVEKAKKKITEVDVSNGTNDLKARIDEIKSSVDSLAKVKLGTDEFGNLKNAVITYTDNLGRAVTETMAWKEIVKEDGNKGNIFTTISTDVTNNVEKIEKAMAAFEKTKQSLQDKLNVAKDNGLINTNVLNNLQIKLDSLNFDNFKNKIGEIEGAINNLSSNDANIVRLQNAISNIENSISSSKGKYKGLIGSEDLKNTLSMVETLKQALNDITNGKNINSKKISSMIGGANASLKTMITNAKNSSSALKLAQKDAISFGNAIQRALGNVGIYTSTALVMRKLFSEIKNGINYVKELDSAFFNISATMDLTKSQFKNITSEVQQMAKDMGISSTKVMKVVQTYANASTNLDDVLGKTQPSIILSNITGMDTGEVTKAAQATINAFKLLEADGATAQSAVERFGDSIVKVSQNMEYDFGDGITEIIDGIKTSGSVAEMAGVSMESYTATLGSVIEATGKSGSEIANGYKMIAARVLQMKDLSDELEVSEDDMGKAEKALKKFDISIREGNGNLRNLDDILKDTAARWTTMTDVEKQYLSEMAAGNRNRNIFVNIMDSMAKSTELYNEALNSSGTMMEIQNKYMDTFEGKLGTLQASFESLSSNMLNSDLMKGTVDGLSSVLNIIDGAVNKFGAVPTVMSGVVGAFSVFNAKARENVNVLAGSITPINKLQNSLNGLGVKFKLLGDKYTSQISLMKTFENSTKTGGRIVDGFGIQLLGLKAKLISTQAGIVACKVALIALNAAFSMALTMGITALISGLGKLIDKIIVTKEEVNELNSEFINSNSGSDTSKIIDLINSYEELENKLSSLTEGTNEYKEIEDKLAATQESILSVYPSASKAIDYNTEAKRLNLEATKKLIDKDLELSKASALDILDKNNTKTDAGLDKAIEDYKEYYKVLQEVNTLSEKGITKSVNIESKLSNSGELLVNAKDVDVYRERVQSLNDTLEASYEAYKILGVSNDSFAEKAKLVGEVLGYSADQTEELINKLQETDEAASDTAEALGDINGDGIVDAVDEMLSLAMSADEAKTAVENLADSFGAFQNSIDLLIQMKEEFEEFGMLDSKTMSKVLSSGDTQLIAALGDEANFLKNINSLLEEKTKAQDEVLKQTIAMAQAEVNASSQVVDATNIEAQAIENLINAKNNANLSSAQERASIEASVVNSNLNNYNADQNNHNSKEDYKIKGSFESANSRMSNEKSVVDNNSKNYATDDKNFVSLANSKIKSADFVINAAIDGTKQMVNANNANYAIDARNYASYINSKINSYRQFAKAQNQGLTLGSLGFKKESEMVLAEFNSYKQQVENIANSIQNTASSYVGSGGVGSGVLHGNLGSGSSGGKGSGGKGSGGKGSSSKDIEDIESLTDRYHDLEDAINDVNNEIEINKMLQESVTGQEKIKLMEKEIQLYKEKQRAIKNLIAEQKKEAQELRNSLSSQGVTFDSKGDIANYNQILTSKVNWANSLSGDAKENAIEQVKELEEAMKSYDELVNKSIPKQEQEWESLNNTIKDVYKTQAELIADVEKNISKTIEYELKKRYDAKKEALNKEKELYNKEYEEANFEEEMNIERNKLAEIQAEIDKVKNDTSRQGQLRLKQLLEDYENQQKIINDKIKEQQNQAINDRFDAEEELLDKELEDMTSAENLSQMVADAISKGMIKIGDETISVKNSMNDMLKETEVGFANVALQQSEWLDNLEQIETLYSSISSIMTNAGMVMPSYDNVSRSMDSRSINITTGGITITGNVDNSTLGSIQDMLDAQAKEIYKNIAKQLS